jgi:hypothetical protein
MRSTSEDRLDIVYNRSWRSFPEVALALVAATSFGCAAPGASGHDSDGGTPVEQCSGGAACTTSNPGACAAGHVVCENGKKVCKPDVTSQSCYSGEPETVTRGTCHAGTQACIGTLGPCMDQVLPKQESCFNDVDDDCDGHVNDGCPTGFSVGQTDPLVARGGNGGDPSSSICPDGSIVTGLQVQLSATGVNPGYVVSVQPTCGTPTLTRGATSYTASLTTVNSPGLMGGSDKARDGTSKIACADGGLSAAAGIQGSVFSSGRIVVESAGLECATLTPSLDSANRLVLDFAPDPSNATNVASVQTNGTKRIDNCGAGEVLVGFQGRTGAQMDQIQGLCAPLTVTYK